MLSAAVSFSRRNRFYQLMLLSLIVPWLAMEIRCFSAEQGGEGNGSWADLRTRSAVEKGLFARTEGQEMLLFQVAKAGAEGEAVRGDDTNENAVPTEKRDAAPTEKLSSASESIRLLERIAVSDLIRYGTTPQPRIHGGLLLVDGSYLVGRVAQWSDDGIEIVGGVFRAEVPRSLVRAVFFAVSSESEQLEEALRDCTTAEGSDDIVVEINGDRWQGLLRWERDALVLMTESGERRFDHRQLRMVISSPRLSVMTIYQRETATRLGFSDGSLLRVKRWEMADSGEGRAELLCGLSLRCRDAGIEGERGKLSGGLVSMIAPEVAPGMTRLAELPLLRSRSIPIIGEPIMSLPLKVSFVPTRGVCGESGGAVYGAIEMPLGTQIVLGLAGGQQRPQGLGRVLDGTTKGRLRGSCQGFPDTARGGDAKRPIAARCRIQWIDSSGKIQPLWAGETGDLGVSLDPGWISSVPIDIELPPARGLILTVERRDPTSVAGRVVWEDLVWEDAAWRDTQRNE